MRVILLAVFFLASMAAAQDAPAPAPAPAAEAEADPPPKGGEVFESTMATAAVKTANDAARALCRKWEMTGTLTTEEEQTIVTEKTKVYDALVTAFNDGKSKVASDADQTRIYEHASGFYAAAKTDLANSILPNMELEESHPCHYV